jgi:hypothetical protein
VIPKAGPAIYSVTGVSYVPIAAATSLERVRFRWPRDVFCTGVWLAAQSGNPADNALLTLQIEDATFQNLFGDGQGGSFGLPALALLGGPTPGAGAPQAGFRWFPLQQPIAKGDLWFFTIGNTATGDHTIVPVLLLTFDEAYPDKIDMLMGEVL